MPDPERTKLTDSPWFWIELFALVAMVGVIVIGPKFLLRQGQLERRLEGRQHALEADGESLPEATQAAPLEERQKQDDHEGEPTLADVRDSLPFTV